MCYFTADNILDHFIKVLFVRFFYYATILFPFVINKYPEVDNLSLQKCPVFSHTGSPTFSFLWSTLSDNYYYKVLMRVSVSLTPTTLATEFHITASCPLSSIIYSIMCLYQLAHRNIYLFYEL